MLLTSSHFFARGCEEQHSSKSHLALIRGHQRPQFSSGSWSEIPSYSHQLHNKLAKWNPMEIQICLLVWRGRGGSRRGSQIFGKARMWARLRRVGEQFSSRALTSKKNNLFFPSIWAQNKKLRRFPLPTLLFPSTPSSHWHKIKPRGNSSSNFQFSLSSGSSSSWWNLRSINYRQF